MVRGKMTLQFSKDQADKLQAEADACGLSVEQYCKMIITGEKPRILELSEEEMKALRERMKSIRSMAFEIISNNN